MLESLDAYCPGSKKMERNAKERKNLRSSGILQKELKSLKFKRNYWINDVPFQIVIEELGPLILQKWWTIITHKEEINQVLRFGTIFLVIPKYWSEMRSYFTLFQVSLLMLVDSLDYF